MIDVVNNADLVLQNLVKISEEYGVTLTNDLKDPWIKTSEQVALTKNDIDTMLDATEVAIGMFNASVNSTIDQMYVRMQQTSSDFTAYLGAPYKNVAASGGPINTFSIKTENALKNAVDKAKSTATEMTTSNKKPWNDGVTAINTWSKSVENAYNKAIQKAREYEAAVNRAQHVGGPSYYSGVSNGGDGGNNPPATTQKSQKTTTANKTYYADVIGGYNEPKIAGINSNMYSFDGGATWIKKSEIQIKTAGRQIEYYVPKGTPLWVKTGENFFSPKYAKGTLGTKKDQWAITDEPQFGDELTLVPTKQGNLSYMRKGTSVVPAAITEELLKLADIGVDGLTMPKFDSGINIVTNAISKPEFNFSFDSMVHVDHCDEGTIKDLEKMVDTKINQFTRQMNYAIRKFK